MNMSLKRFSTVILSVCLLGFAAAGSVYAGGHQPQPQPQPKPQPQPQPQPKPQPVQQDNSHRSSIIGSLKPDKAAGSTHTSSIIGTLKPQKSSEVPVIGDLKPSNPTQTPVIGNVRPSSSGSKIIGGQPTNYVEPIIDQTQQAVKEIQPKIPQIEQQVRQQAEPMIPQIQQAAQQALNDPAVQQIVQENPQLNEPIIITPRSVRAGNASSGSSRSRNSYGAGYSGGNGDGPLIYNP